MASFNAIYLPCVVITAAIFAVLSFLGPPLPVTRDTNIPEQALTWQIQLNNDSYGGWNDESDQLWDTIVPNNGVVLATNLTSGFHFWANVAMFHQLKCLRDIRSRLIALAGSWDEVEAFTAWRGPGSEYERIGSCFDYVRQGILCHADTTLHPKAIVSEERFVIDGNALWHKCKESTALYNWAIRSGPPHKDPRVLEQPSP